MLDIEYTHKMIQKIAEGIHEILHIDLSTPMTLLEFLIAKNLIATNAKYL